MLFEEKMDDGKIVAVSFLLAFLVVPSRSQSKHVSCTHTSIHTRKVKLLGKFDFLMTIQGFSNF